MEAAYLAPESSQRFAATPYRDNYEQCGLPLARSTGEDAIVPLRYDDEGKSVGCTSCNAVLGLRRSLNR
jgi:hypothetical protein